MKYDVIIIGSGFGGLVCGHILSKQGKNVLLLERQAQPGGCIQSYRRDGMAFDTGLHYVGGLAEGQTMHRLFDTIGLMRLPWYRLDPKGFDLVTIGSDTFALAEGYDAFVDTLAADFPKEREALRKYTDLLRLTQELDLGSADTSAMQTAGAYEWLTTTFHDSLLVNVLSGNALKMELRRESLPLFTFAHGQSSYVQSSWRLQGDGNMIVRSLTDDISRYGGTIRCRAEVEELIEHDGRIVAARCRNGETYEGETFISDIHPSLTFDLVKDTPLLKRIFRKRMGMMENTYGMLTVSLVLKPETLRYFNHNKFLYARENVWTFHEEGDGIGGMMVSARVPEEGEYVRQLDLLTPMSWTLCEQWADTSVGRRGEDYKQLKDQLADDCIALAETVIPGLASMVSGR